MYAFINSGGNVIGSSPFSYGIAKNSKITHIVHMIAITEKKVAGITISCFFRRSMSWRNVRGIMATKTAERSSKNLLSLAVRIRKLSRMVVPIKHI